MERDNKALYTLWLDIWNGKLELIDEIVSEKFVFHPTHGQPGQPDFNGRSGVRQMVGMSREPFKEIHFTTDIGPISEDDMVVARWQGEGVYDKGLPGATAAPGTKVAFSAIDILRIKDGKISEYWHNADDLSFMLQVGAAKMNEAN